MAKSPSSGAAGKPAGKPSPFADRRIIVLIVLVVGVIGFYGFQSWKAGADRAAAREKLISDTAAELAKEAPSRDELSSLMARIGRLPDASTASDLLAAQAEIELVRGRPERADNLFGSIASSPDARPDELRLGSRILLAKAAGFSGDVVEGRSMLQQVQSMAEVAYADSRDVADLFRAWLASIRLWDTRSKEFANQLKSAHAETAECKLAQLNQDFSPARDRQVVADLLIDFATPPDELRAMETVLKLQSGDVPSALKMAEDHANQSPGVQGVRYIAAFVLHGCALGSPADSADRAVFIKRRNAHLDWLDQRVPEGVDKKWDAMRKTR